MPLDIMCPKCHRIFSREIEHREVVDEEVVSSPSGPPVIMGGGALQDPNMMPEPKVPKEVVTYKYQYKCRHCGYEWTDVKTEEKSFKDSPGEL